jgi:hypothetical protein
MVIKASELSPGVRLVGLATFGSGEILGTFEKRASSSRTGADSFFHFGLVNKTARQVEQP